MLHKYYHWLLRHVDYFVFLLFFVSPLFTVLLFMSCCFWHSCQFVCYPAGKFYCLRPNHPVIFDPTWPHKWKAAHWWAYLSYCFDPVIFLTQQDYTSGKLLNGEPFCPVLTQLFYCFWPNHPIIFDPTGQHKWNAAHWWAYLSYCFDLVILLFLT